MIVFFFIINLEDRNLNNYWRAFKDSAVNLFIFILAAKDTNL